MKWVLIMIYAMSSPPPPLPTPPMSQGEGSQKLPSLDSAKWHLANEQRLAAIELQRVKVRDLELTRQGPNQQRIELELEGEKDNVLNYKDRIREVDRLARKRWLDDAAQQQMEKLAAVDKLRRERTDQRDLRERCRARERQRKLDEDAARRAEVRRVKEQQEADREERSRLNSLAIVQQTQETLRLQEVARAMKHREENIPRGEAGIRATGRSKRSADTQQATRSRQLEGGQSR
jgi:hypothetical protein